MISDHLVEITNYRINLGLGKKVESLLYGRQVILHIVIKENLEVHWIKERFRRGVKSEEVLCV